MIKELLILLCMGNEFGLHIRTNLDSLHLEYWCIYSMLMEKKSIINVYIYLLGWCVSPRERAFSFGSCIPTQLSIVHNSRNGVSMAALLYILVCIHLCVCVCVHVHARLYLNINDDIIFH